MRRFYSSALASLILLLGSQPAKAEWDLWGFIDGDDNKSVQIYTINSSTGEKELRDTFTSSSNISYDKENTYINQLTGNPTIYFDDGAGGGILRSFDLDTLTWTTESSSPTDFDGIYQRQLIRKDGNIYSLGANSLKLEETSGAQKMWATNSSGEIAPIDITNGTKLLINGRDVEQAIDNVGALSAALTALPTVPQDLSLIHI